MRAHGAPCMHASWMHASLSHARACMHASRMRMHGPAAPQQLQTRTWRLVPSAARFSACCSFIAAFALATRRMFWGCDRVGGASQRSSEGAEGLGAGQAAECACAPRRSRQQCACAPNQRRPLRVLSKAHTSEAALKSPYGFKGTPAASRQLGQDQKPAAAPATGRPGPGSGSYGGGGEGPVACTSGGGGLGRRQRTSRREQRRAALRARALRRCARRCRRPLAAHRPPLPHIHHQATAALPLHHLSVSLQHTASYHESCMSVADFARSAEAVLPFL